jgi:cell division protein FtsL
LLAIEAATLRQPARIEAIARGALGMDVPEPSRVMSAAANKRRLTAGRVR